MADNVIDASSEFMALVCIRHLESLIDKDPKYHSYCRILEENEEDYLELRLHNIKDNFDIVIEKATVTTFKQRKSDGKPLFEIY